MLFSVDASTKCIAYNNHNKLCAVTFDMKKFQHSNFVIFLNETQTINVVSKLFNWNILNAEHMLM